MALKQIYLLDTNIVSELAKPSPDEKLPINLDAQSCFSVISSTVWYEILKGIAILPEESTKSKLDKYATEYVQAVFPILPYDEHCASLQANIDSKMKEKGTSLPYKDAQIAATALANNLILVTRNTKDFEPICREFPLHVENWFEYVESRHANA